MNMGSTSWSGYRRVASLKIVKPFNKHCKVVTEGFEKVAHFKKYFYN